MHKHLQVFEVPQDFSLFPDRAREDAAKAPYRYFLEYFSSKSPTALEVLSAYKSCCQIPDVLCVWGLSVKMEFAHTT